MQAATLQGQAVNTVVGHGDTAEAFGQVSRVAVLNDGANRKNIASFDDCIHEPGFNRTSHLGVVILGLPCTVVRHHINGATCAGSPITRVEFQAQHRKRVDTKANGTLGESRLKLPDDSMGPLFRVTITCAARLPLTKVTIEVEVAIQNSEAAALDEAFGLFFGGNCSLSGADTQSYQR